MTSVTHLTCLKIIVHGGCSQYGDQYVIFIYVFQVGHFQVYFLSTITAWAWKPIGNGHVRNPLRFSSRICPCYRSSHCFQCPHSRWSITVEKCNTKRSLVFAEWEQICKYTVIRIYGPMNSPFRGCYWVAYLSFQCICCRQNDFIRQHCLLMAIFIRYHAIAFYITPNTCCFKLGHNQFLVL